MYGSTQATLVTTGMLPFLLLLSAALTAPVSIGLLAIYRRAVLRSMAAVSPHANDKVPAAESAVQPPGTKLQLSMLDSDSFTSPAVERRIKHSLWRAALVYTAGGLTYALILGGAWMVQAGGDGFVLMRFLWLLSCYAWPTALGLGLLLAVTTSQRMLVAAVYFAMLFAVSAFALLRNDALSVGQVAAFWMITNAPATAILLAFLHRRVRAVGPLVLAFMVCAVTGSQIALSAVGSSEQGMRAAVTAGSALGLGGHGTFYATMILGAISAGLVGWYVLKWLGRRHTARLTSDQTLTLDAMWLLFGMVQSITFAFEGWAWIFTGLVAFAAYKTVTTVGFRIAGLGHGSARSPSLLLLRVFALGARSGELFDTLAKRWMRTGDISMIAGPDLATSTVEPHEFLDFVGGRLSSQFVQNESDLDARIRSRALGPDPDGRYRANEFFCHADTWQLAMRKLAANSDAVLMDLRSFTASNQGCQYELQQLINIVPLTRVLYIVDDTTDLRFLHETLKQRWLNAAEDSPNRKNPAPAACIVDVSTGVSKVMRPLLALVETA